VIALNTTLLTSAEMRARVPAVFNVCNQSLTAACALVDLTCETDVVPSKSNTTVNRLLVLSFSCMFL
jgi:hypothetical protein